jgi:hypothetical protein
MRSGHPSSSFWTTPYLGVDTESANFLSRRARTRGEGCSKEETGAGVQSVFRRCFAVGSTSFSPTKEWWCAS